jgi:putative sigma-54 modulation protein
MELIVNGRNVEITDWVREYVEKKVSKLERYLPQAIDARAELIHSAARAAEDRYTAELTIWTNGRIFRAEESTSDIFASIDATVDKLSRQIDKFKGRRIDQPRRATAAALAHIEAEIAASAEAEAAEAATSSGNITRRKQFVVQPMNEEEALEQMELLGHDFYLFFNPEVNAVNLIYRRKDGNYGLLQPIVA